MSLPGIFGWAFFHNIIQNLLFIEFSVLVTVEIVFLRADFKNSKYTV